MDILKLINRSKQRVSTVFSVLLLFITLISVSYASEKEDLTVLRNTVVNLLQNLVEQGIMSQDQANALVEKARSEAAEEAAAEPEEIPEDVVRVPYVPEIVKDEIRQQVRDELRREVVDDVVAHAKRERWGVRDALPGWLNRITVSGDIRVRAEQEIYDNSNVEEGINSPYFDYQSLNENGPVTVFDLGDPTNTSDIFLNTSENRTRQRVRLRLNIDAQISESITAGVSLTTGNTTNPVSVNQTLGNSSSSKDLVLDRAFIEYNAPGENDWLTLTAGRFENPWFSTDLLWDDDLSFEGVAGTLRYNFGNQNSLFSSFTDDANIYLTMGAFPLDEFERSSNLDRWLLGGQIGTNWNLNDKTNFSLAAAYYDFRNVQAPVTPRDFDEFEASAPGFLQRGNTIFVVANPIDPDGPTVTGNETVLFGLASDYNLINLTGSLNLTHFAPYHLGFTADYVRNVGYDDDDVDGRILAEVSGETTGYHLRLDFGWPTISQLGHWNVFFAYKYVERDAVLDAFTDSNFGLGGTDSQGWELGGRLGISDNTFATLTWRSASEIDGPALNGLGECDDLINVSCDFGTDLIQLDLTSEF